MPGPWLCARCPARLQVLLRRLRHEAGSQVSHCWRVQGSQGVQGGAWPEPPVCLPVSHHSVTQHPPGHPPAPASVCLSAQPSALQSPGSSPFTAESPVCSAPLDHTAHPIHCLPAAASTRSSPSASSSGSRAPALLRSMARSCSNASAGSSRAPAPAFRKWSADSTSSRPLSCGPNSRLCARTRR